MLMILITKDFSAGLQIRAHAGALRLAIAALKVVGDALKRARERPAAALAVVMQLQLFRARAVEDRILRGLRDLAERRRQLEAVLFCAQTDHRCG